MFPNVLVNLSANQFIDIMDITEFNKELDVYKPQLDSANRVQMEINGHEVELMEIIKKEMKKRGINAIKIDLYGEIGDEADIDDWNLMYLYEDDERREVASVVYLDYQDNLQFDAYFEHVGFSKTIITPYVKEPETPAIIFSVGPLKLKAARPYSYYGHYCQGDGIITGECDLYQNGVVHLAAVFGKCMEIYDKEVSGKA